MEVLEPHHAVVYFSPQTRQAMEDAGLRGFWRGYFAGRAAPMGSVGAGPVSQRVLRRRYRPGLL